MAVKRMTESFPLVEGLLLRLSFRPEAIREHYGVDSGGDPGDDPVARLVARMTDAQLRRVGLLALSDAALYRAFDAALATAVREVAGE